MDLLIKFRADAPQLNEAEIKRLMHTFIESCNKNEITSCIFDYFYTQYSSKKAMNKLQNINDSISTIISNRKQMEQSENGNDISMDDIDEDEQEPLSIYSLPTEIINECSSYLDYTDHQQFGQCNQSIFISINNPLKLYHLDITKMMKKQNKPYIKSNNIKVLRSMMNNPNQYLSNSWIERLTLNFNTFIKFINPNACYHEYSTAESDIKSIIKSTEIKDINLSNIKHLTVKINANTPPTSDNLCDFLHFFPNLEHLSVCCDHAILINPEIGDRNAIINKMENLCPNLTMISTNIHDFFNEQLIKMNRNQLVSLKYNTTLNVNLADFSKLRELQIKNAKITELSAAISKLPVLERLRMDGIDSDYTDYDMKMMTIGITKCRSLQYIGFYDNCRNCTLFVRFLKNAFIETIPIQRERIKISLKVLPSSIWIKITDTKIPKFKNVKFVDEIKNFLNGMDIISIDWMDFMIRISLYKRLWRTFESIIEIIRKYQDEYSIFVMDDFVIISNKNCKINGYGERWLNKTTNCSEC